MPLNSQCKDIISFVSSMHSITPSFVQDVLLNISPNLLLLGDDENYDRIFLFCLILTDHAFFFNFRCVRISCQRYSLFVFDAIRNFGFNILNQSVPPRQTFKTCIPKQIPKIGSFNFSASSKISRSVSSFSRNDFFQIRTRFFAKT